MIIVPVQCRKCEGNLAEASAGSASHSCGGGFGFFFVFFWLLEI